MSTATEAIPAPAAAREKQGFQPSTAGWVARRLVLFAILGGVLLITYLVSGVWADRIALASIYAIIGLSLNVILGYLGQVSLGHHGFVGIGSFAAAYFVTDKAHCTLEKCAFSSFAMATLIAILTGVLAAAILGLAALRIGGLYLALITLTYGFVAQNSIFEIEAFTGGGGGKPAPRPDGFQGDTAFAYLTFAVLALVVFVDWRLMKSKVGRAILSIKHSEPVAASYGVNVTSYKILAFMVSGMFAGLGGALLAFNRTQVSPPDFNFETALLWVLMVVVGGLGNRTGVIVGSAFFALFPSLFELIGPIEHWAETSGRALAFISITVGSALAVLTIVQYQGGIAEQISPITRWLRGEKFSMHPEGHGHGPKKKHGGGLAARLKRSKTEGGDPGDQVKEREPESPTQSGDTTEMATAKKDGS